MDGLQYKAVVSLKDRLGASELSVLKFSQRGTESMYAVIKILISMLFITFFVVGMFEFGFLD